MNAAHWSWLVVAAVAPLGVEVLLFALDVPLGEPGRFTYGYSPIVTRRAAALPAALAVAGLLGYGVWLLFAREVRRRSVGRLLVVGGIVGGAGWTYLAPPDFRSQHFFNMQSPSHDGAFLTEAGQVRRVGLRDYLRRFPVRAQRPPAEMKGTRVISNPPGTTLVAVGTVALLDACPRLRAGLERWVLPAGLEPPARHLIITSLAFSGVLWLLWLVAVGPLYGLARMFLGPALAATFAIVCLFSPMTMLFTPGKDPAQLLTVALPLYFWLLGWRGQRHWAAGLAGGMFVLSCLVSLVHVWIAAVVLVASVLSDVRPGPRPGAQDLRAPGGRLGTWLRLVLAALGGAGVIVLLLRLLVDFDFFAAAWSVTRSQAEVTRGAHAMPLVWQTLGIPLFLLFAGVGLSSAVLWLRGRRLLDADARFGRYLVLGCAAVMVATIGFTNLETPRLWIPFTPLLLLGGVLQLPALRRPGSSMALLLAGLVFLQFSAAAAQWSLIDARQAETRLLWSAPGGPRFFH